MRQTKILMAEDIFATRPKEIHQPPISLLLIGEKGCGVAITALNLLDFFVDGTSQNLSLDFIPTREKNSAIQMAAGGRPKC